MKVEVADGEETADSKTLGVLEAQGPYDPKKDLENYRYPTLDLLKKYDNDGKPYIDMAEQNANKNRSCNTTQDANSGNYCNYYYYDLFTFIRIHHSLSFLLFPKK